MFEPSQCSSQSPHGSDDKGDMYNKISGMYETDDPAHADVYCTPHMRPASAYILSLLILKEAKVMIGSTCWLVSVNAWIVDSGGQTT